MGGVHTLAEGPLVAGAIVFRTDPQVFKLVAQATPVLREGTHKGHVATVVAKLWLDITADGVTIAEPTEPLLATDIGYADGRSRGPYAPADLLPFKLRPEVLVVGDVEPRGGQAVAQLDTRVRIGSVDKRVQVHADRWVDGAGRLHQGAPFVAMPIVYERTGAGSWNPVGVRATTDPAFVPNFVPVGAAAPATIADLAGMTPISFAPLSWAWPIRQGGPGRVPQCADFLSEVPVYVAASWHLAAFNAAPPDQQIARLGPDDRLLLEGFFADAPRFEAPLSAMRPVARVARGPGRALGLDTIWVDVSRRRAALTYRGIIPMADAREAIEVAVGLERAKAPETRVGGGRMGSTLERGDLDWSAPLPFKVPAQAAEPRAGEADLSFGLPFQSGDGAPPPPMPPAAPAGDLHSFAAQNETVVQDVNETICEILSDELPESGHHALSGTPFAPAPELIPAPPPAPQPAKADVVVAAPKVSSATSFAEVVRMLAFAPASVAALRAVESFQPVLAVVAAEPLDPELDEPDIFYDVAALEDRRVVERLLGAATALGEAEVRQTFRRAVDECVGNRYGRPIVAVEGALQVAPDELDLLRATLAVAASHDTDNPAALDAVSVARAFLDSPGIPGAPDVAVGLATRVRGAFERASLALATSFEDAVDAVLLEKRSRIRRRVLGGTFVRAAIVTSSPAATFPAYLHESMEPALPGVRSLPVRALVRLHAPLHDSDPKIPHMEILAVGLKTPLRGGLS